MGDRQIVPEPPVRPRTENRILSEAPPDLAVVLWQYVRHLRDWIDALPSERRALFHVAPARWVLEKRQHARTISGELVDDLMCIEAVLESPLTVEVRQLAGACERVAQWADTQGYRETGIQFAELAALADPEEPRRANLVGRLTRNASEYASAELWLERGIGLARRRADWVEYTRGHLGAGILCMWSGCESRARQHFNTASSIAMREGHEWLAAEAQHDLFHFMTIRGQYVDAEMHARRALAWYPKHHHRFPFFAADVAYLLVCQRHYSAAVTVLRCFVQLVQPPQNVLGFSLFVRALASAGLVEEFERTREQLFNLLQHHGEHEAGARWHLAYGERAVGSWDSARTNALKAVDLARLQRDHEMEQLALTVLAEVNAGEPPRPELRRNDRKFKELVDTLTTRLSNWSPTRRGRSRSLSRADWAA
jgi:hypothetical protein